MMTKRLNSWLFAGGVWALLGTLAGNALAINGAGSVNLTPDNGWLAFELVTQGNSLVGISDPGYGNTVTRGKNDGLGTYVDGNKLSVYVNHEQTPAAISRVDVSISSLRQAVESKLDAGATAFPASFVTGMGYAYARIYDGTYHAINNPNPAASGTPAIVNYANANFARFCSGSSYSPQAFGTGRGVLDPMYITGEEVTGGKFYAIDQVTHSMWEVPDFGLGAWENAAQVDTGNTTHVAFVLSPDVGSPNSDYLRLYVGEKGIDANGDGTTDFLERNGMRGGSIYYFTPNPPASITDLPDGAVAGKWTLSTAGALREDKLEDIHTNPLDGTQLVFADQTDGIYRIDMPMQFAAGAFDSNNSPVNIYQIDDDDIAPIGAPDNLFWSRNGKIYVQEDGNGDEMWQIDADGTNRARIATAFSEPSGIIDASVELGYQPDSVLLSSIMGSGAAGAQLVAMISPTAQLAFPRGDFNRDGVVDAADYVVWRKGLAADYAPADYNIWREHFGQDTPGTGSGSTSPPAVPEPATILLVLSVAAICYPKRPVRWC